jgi:hypothetical protein
MAKEPEGISRTFADFNKAAANAIVGGLGFANDARQAIGNVGRYFKSEPQVPIGKPAPAANSATAEQKIQGIRDLFGKIDQANAAGAGSPEEAAPAPGGGGGGRSNLDMLNEMFSPLFENLAQREEAANKRYEANTQQVTNIYGQITNARTADIGTTATAFQRLADAAATRSSAVNTQIDESEAARLRNNQAALESMGLAGLSTPQGDIASQGAAMAQNTNRLNAENWQGLLSAMGVNAQDIARSDVTGFNYRMGEDLGQLRGAREQFAQDIEQQRSQLVSQKAQATFEYQQAQQRAAAAAAAAQQRAAFDAQDAAAKQQAEALKGSGPVTQIVASRFNAGFLTANEAARVTDSINEWFSSGATPPGGRWNAGSARSSLLGTAGDQLNSNEKSAIVAIFDKMNW